MTNPFPGAGANPPAGGRGADPSGSNPPAGGSQSSNAALAGALAGGVAGSNPLAGGSSDPQASNPPSSTTNDDDAPVSMAVFREKARSEAVLRKEVQELRAWRQAQEEAKLTKDELANKRLADLEAERSEWHIERQELRMQREVDAQVTRLNLLDADLVLSVLTTQYRDRLDTDEDGNYTNVAGLIAELVTKYPMLQKPTNSTPTVPGSGRQVSPPRTPAGQYAQYAQQRPQQAPQPVPYTQFERLGDLTEADWDTTSRNQQQGQR